MTILILRANFDRNNRIAVGGVFGAANVYGGEGGFVVDRNMAFLAERRVELDIGKADVQVIDCLLLSLNILYLPLVCKLIAVQFYTIVTSRIVQDIFKRFRQLYHEVRFVCFSCVLVRSVVQWGISETKQVLLQEKTGKKEEETI